MHLPAALFLIQQSLRQPGTSAETTVSLRTECFKIVFSQRLFVLWCLGIRSTGTRAVSDCLHLVGYFRPARLIGQGISFLRTNVMSTGGRLSEAVHHPGADELMNRWMGYIAKVVYFKMKRHGNAKNAP